MISTSYLMGSRDFILSASDLNKVALLLLVVQEKDCYAAVEVHAEESVLDLQHVFFLLNWLEDYF